MELSVPSGEQSEPEPCADTLGTLYPFPSHHPQRDGVCVRCGQDVDPDGPRAATWAEEQAARGLPVGPAVHGPEERTTTAGDSLRQKLIYFLENHPSLKGVTGHDGKPIAETMVNDFAHQQADRARTGIAIFEDHVGGFQYAREMREIIDVIDPTAPDPDGWDF